MIWGAKKNEAMKMRMVGRSYNEIHATLGIPKSTLASWFSNMVLSDAAHARLQGRVKAGSRYFIKRNKMQTKLAWDRARKTQREASAEIPPMSRSDILLVGTALYWAEGYKRLLVRDGKERPGHVIGFVNSDAAMIRMFIRFLRECLDTPVEKIKVHMRLYDHMNETQMRTYWVAETGLLPERFGKTTRLVSISSQRKKGFNRLPHGTLQVEVYETEKFHRILGWIEGMKKRI